MPADRDELVSIIMPSHNSAPFIAESIDSVLAQTYSNWELLIVDDCSVDTSVAVIQSYVDRDSRIRLTTLPENGGSAVSRNSAIAAAAGRYIAFLDSDDLWLPNKLDEQIGFMRATGSPFTYTSYQRMTEAGIPIGPFLVPERTTYSRLLKHNVIACLTAIYDTAHYGKTHMPLIRKGQDYGLWLKLLERGGEARGLTKVLARYRVRENSISANKLESSMWVWRIYREVMGLSLPRALWNFGFYAASGVAIRTAERVRGRIGRKPTGVA